VEIIETIIERISEHPHSRASEILASALASACSSKYGVSLLDVSVALDQSNQDLVLRLVRISYEDDFSNASQDRALRWLSDEGYIAP